MGYLRVPQKVHCPNHWYVFVKFLKRKYDVIELFLRVLVVSLTLFNTGLQVDGFVLEFTTKLTRN